MNPDLYNRIRQCPNLPSLPTIAMQVLELAQKADVDIAEIARIISKDPALSGKILRTVNSSFYARSHAVGTISQALVILGLQSVKTLVLGFSLVTTLSKNKSKGFKHLLYWKRSICAATAARTIARKLQLVQQEEAFLAALLADIGMLVFDMVLGQQYGDICEKALTHTDLVEAETAALQCTHADVGAVLAQQWKLPPLLATPIACSHNLPGVTDPSLLKLTEVVALASWCADVFVDEEAAPAIARVRQFCADQYKMSQVDCDAMLEDIGKRTKEVASLFEINIGGNTNFEMILKKANEALVELTLQTQQQASQLQVQNQELKKQAHTDGLTGIANRARFDLVLAEQFAKSQATGKPLTLLLMDVDKFKSVNDTHGHQSGDQVLRVIGKLLATAARAEHLAARYGGEEMAMILPATSRGVGASIAETIRKAICTRPIATTAGALPITISIGVATLEPGGPFKSPAHLLKAADMAVYAAKHGGRNCVKVFAMPTSKEAA
jgi:two-component system, cell cycle response regulator